MVSKRVTRLWITGATESRKVRTHQKTLDKGGCAKVRGRRIDQPGGADGLSARPVFRRQSDPPSSGKGPGSLPMIGGSNGDMAMVVRCAPMVNEARVSTETASAAAAKQYARKARNPACTTMTKSIRHRQNETAEEIKHRRQNSVRSVHMTPYALMTWATGSLPSANTARRRSYSPNDGSSTCALRAYAR